MVSEVDILNLVEKLSGKKLQPHHDIWLRSGLSGDDWHEFIDNFAHRYDVNMLNYRWYYHGDEEGFMNIGSWFYPPPQDQVDRIPVTASKLANVANAKIWNIKYPQEEVDLSRRDLKVNRIILCSFLVIMIILLLNKVVILNNYTNQLDMIEIVKQIVLGASFSFGFIVASGLLIFFFRTFLSSAITASIKHFYDLRLEKVRIEEVKRQKAILIAELLSEWIARPEDVKILNKLTFEAFIWLPKATTQKLSQVLSHQTEKENFRTLIAEIRELILGSKEGIEPGTIIFFSRKESPNENDNIRKDERGIVSDISSLSD